MPNQYGAAAQSYTGLAPEDALKAWFLHRQQVATQYGIDLSKADSLDFSKLPPDVIDSLDMTQLKNENPGAWQLLKTGGNARKEDGKNVRDVFNTNTGEFDTKKVKGYWDNWESWAQLAMGAGLGAGVGIAALGANAATQGATMSPSLAAAVGAPAASTTATTVATTAAPLAAAAAKGGIKNWLTGNAGSLISEGANAIGGIYASKKAAGAADEAAKLEAEAYDKALAAEREQKDYDRNQYADYLGRLDPYAQTGYGANDRLAAFSGQAAPPRPAPLQRPAMTTPGADTIPYGQRVPPGIQTAATMPTNQPMASPQLVKLQAPDGSFKDVPADQAQHFISMGARPAQAGA